MDLYECEKCKDRGYIYHSETNSCEICECEERKIYERILEKSGISEQFRKKGFKEFETKTEFQKQQKL